MLKSPVDIIYSSFNHDINVNMINVLIKKKLNEDKIQILYNL